ncbi:MAG: DUF4838 domain-containing protein [Kiritimatiellae bacterium]|nr:DUF4838 domain-containing protein [Kiritimatiellia bacterium]
MKQIIVAAVLVCGASVIGSGSGDGRFVVASGGSVKCAIVSNGHDGQARELAKYIGRIVGAVVPVVSNDTEVAKGQGKIVLAAGKALSDGNKYIEMQSYRIAAKPGLLTITGPTERAIYYGVFGFLEEHLDCRFFTRDDEYVPQCRELALAPFEDAQKPAFPVRGAVWGFRANDIFAYKLRAGGEPFNWRLAGHSIATWANAKVNLKEHPEYLALEPDGKRCTWSLCGTSEEGAKDLGRRLADEYDKKKLGAKPEGERCLTVAQMDGNYRNCCCEKCKALIESEGTESAPLFLLLNRALEEAQKTHPDLSLITYGYFNTLYPPKTLKPNPKFWVCVVSSSLSQNQSGDQLNGICESPSNRHYRDGIKEWTKYLDGRTSIYHWNGPDPGNSEYSEWPNTFPLCENYRYWRDCGVGCAQFSSLPSGDPGWFKGWICYRMLWNPDVDYRALLRDAFDKRFGAPAARHLWDYLLYVDQVRREANYPVSCVRWPSFINILCEKLWRRQDVEKMDAFFENALAAAKAEGDARHVERVLRARALHLDQILLASGRSEPLKVVTDPASGRKWVMHGDDPKYLKSLQNFADFCIKFGRWPQTKEERLGAAVREAGGEAHTVAGGGYEALSVPWLKGAVHSLKKDGVELFAQHNGVSGYRETFPGNIVTWLPEDGGGPDGFSMKAYINLAMYRCGYGKFWFWRKESAGKDGYVISRGYHQGDYKKCGISPGMSSRAVFSATFCLKLADIEAAAVGVKGQGISKAVSLAGLETGSGVAVSAKRGADLLDADCQNPLYDQAEEIPVGSDMSVSLPTNDAPLAVTFARGDGVTVTISTVAKGWKAVGLRPDPQNGCIDVNFTAHLSAVGKGEIDLELPSFTVTAAGKPREVASRRRKGGGKPVQKIRKIDANHAINEIDGAEMVRIPKGAFLMGTPAGRGCRDEWPQRKIELGEYWIYKKPVTLGMYKKFCEATGQKLKSTWCQRNMLEMKERGATEDDYAVCLSWNEAERYAKWAGMNLPTEAQWVKAARGDKDDREYPWGDEWDGTKAVGWEMTLERFRDGMLPVGSVPSGASPYGVLDMAGNCFEWVRDWYSSEYWLDAPAKNPTGPATGRNKVLKGGDSAHAETFSRISFRYLCPPSARDWVKVSFRCAFAAGD